ncbi:MAG TPA: response regulator [Terriglobales bacterium]|jgi:CheY-like chemotaxis protein
MPGFTKLVLLVDDDPADRALFSRELKKAGFEVFATGDADRAMARIVSGDIGCVVTDQAMSVTGHELVEIVRGIRSDIGVIFLSGADAPAQPVPPGVPFINKGDVARLLQHVGECMSRWTL